MTTDTPSEAGQRGCRLVAYGYVEGLERAITALEAESAALRDMRELLREAREFLADYDFEDFAGDLSDRIDRALDGKA